MFKLAALSVVFIGCATGRVGAPQVRLSGSPIARAPIDPQLPSVDRIENEVRAKLGPIATTEVNVCVRPSGKIRSVELVGGSAYPPFDLAVVENASTWSYPAIPGPDSVQSCELETVRYHHR